MPPVTPKDNMTKRASKEMKPRSHKTDRKRQEARLDEVCSEYVRKRAIMLVGGCQRCHSLRFDIQKDNGSILPAWKQLDWAHLFGRGHTVRWDVSATAGLCGGCHIYIDTHHVAKEQFIRQLLGDHDCDRLYVLSQMSSKQSPVDYKMTEIYLKTLIKQLDGKIGG